MTRRNVSLTAHQIQYTLRDWNDFMGKYSAVSTTTKEVIKELYDSLTPAEKKEFDTEICTNQHAVFLEIVGKIKKKKGAKK